MIDDARLACHWNTSDIMRPANKNRSRSKNNRKSVGNVINRVFDSAGPEGKVRGTPQQIIEKYQTLARDAQLAGDRVATENFLQHSEHYTRMLNDAQRQIDAQNAARQDQQQERNRAQQQPGDGEQPSVGEQAAEPLANGSALVDDAGGDGGTTLVETPESAPRKPRSRRPRRSADAQQQANAAPQETDVSEPAGAPETAPADQTPSI
ncbi:MAG: DUF4167 domain-containing protein [Pseudomonadota bacterium]